MTDRLRLVVMGDTYVGKSSVIKRFLFGSCPEKYVPTVEDLYSRDFELADTTLKIDILDTSGDTQFPAMRRLSISSAHAFLLVYSVTDTKSFLTVKHRFEEIREERSNYQDIPIVVLANKTDMVEEVEPNDVQQWMQISMSKNRSRFMECSALENINVRDVFKAFLTLSKIEFAPKCGFAREDGGLRRNLSVKIKGSRSKSPSFLRTRDDSFALRPCARSPTFQNTSAPRSRKGSCDSSNNTPATTPRSDRKFFGLTLGSPFSSPKAGNGCPQIYATNSHNEIHKISVSGDDSIESELPLRNSKRSRSLIRRSSKKVKEQMSKIQSVDDCNVS